MSRQNVEAARETLAAVDRRDLAALVELTDPEIEWRSYFADLFVGGQYRGHDGLRKYVSDLDEAWDILEPEIHDLLDAGDVVVGVGRIHYRGRESGVDSQVPAGWMFKFRQGKLLCFRAFREPQQALEAVGLEKQE